MFQGPDGRRHIMWNKILATIAAGGCCIAFASDADAQRMGMGMSQHAGFGAQTSFHASSRMATIGTRSAFTSRAQMRGPHFTPEGWSHGRKVGWHCRLGTHGCIPPGLR
jgi:hypothetical protein